jgi:hypothetical protein
MAGSRLCRGFAGHERAAAEASAEDGKPGHDKHTSLSAAVIKVNKGFKLRAAV